MDTFNGINLQLQIGFHGNIFVSLLHFRRLMIMYMHYLYLFSREFQLTCALEITVIHSVWQHFFDIHWEMDVTISSESRVNYFPSGYELHSSVSPYLTTPNVSQRHWFISLNVSVHIVLSIWDNYEAESGTRLYNIVTVIGYLQYTSSSVWWRRIPLPASHA